MHFSKRLIETLKSSRSLRASPTSLAREFNFHFVGKPITVHAARKWLVGEAIPTQDKLRALANWLGVSVDWLRFGGIKPALTNPQISCGQGSPQDSLIRLYLSLPQRERGLARDFIHLMVEKNRSEAANRKVEKPERAYST